MTSSIGVVGGRRRTADASAHDVTAVTGRPKLVASGGGSISTIPDAELAASATILSAARSAMSDREPTLAEVLSAVREALGARDLFILCARAEVCGAGIEVTAFPVRQALQSLPANLASEASTWDHGRSRRRLDAPHRHGAGHRIERLGDRLRSR